MMREIKFRGIKTGNQGFRYGHYHKLGEQHFIRTGSMLSSVYEDTIGQYTGVKDKNGKEVYEGDILKFEHLKDYSNEYQIVSFTECSFGTNDFEFWEILRAEYVFEVVGNIYENKELLRGY